MAPSLTLDEIRAVANVIQVAASRSAFPLQEYKPVYDLQFRLLTILAEAGRVDEQTRGLFPGLPESIPPPETEKTLTTIEEAPKETPVKK